MLSDRRNSKAAHRFLGKALKIMQDWPPSSIATDKLGSYPKAIQRLKREGAPADAVEHRALKYLYNIIEADHGAMKPVIRRARSFRTKRTACATIKGSRPCA